MKELIRLLSNIPDAYDDFIFGTINYAKKDPSHINILKDFMRDNTDLTSSDLIAFIVSQSDFHSYSVDNAWEENYMCEALKELMKDEIEAAREEARKEMIYSLVSEGDISPEKGAQKLGISVEQLNSDMSASATPRRL